jgi:hypothetical protein
MPSVLVATAEGLLSFDDRGAVGAPRFEGRSVTAVAPEREALWAIVDGTEIWHAPGRTDWVPAGALDGYRATCLAATDALLVGTSEARLFRMAGGVIEALASFDGAEGRAAWHTPWGGPPDTRSISEWDEAVYVNVHVGGILRTTDGGASWTPTIDIDADVHQVTTAEGLVLAACAGGLAVSADRGVAWTMRTDGLEARYARAVSVCADTVLLSASSGPRGGRAAIYRGNLAGGRLERCRAGVPEWFDDNVDTHCLDALPDGSFAAFGTTDGRLFGSADTGATWEPLADGLRAVDYVLVLP